MSTDSRKFKPFSLVWLAGLLTVILLATSVSAPASAATPPQPTYASATVDGNPGEWNLADDFFANMYRAADPSKEVESKLYLRYACPTVAGTPGILYALVLTEPGVTVNPTDDGQFIKLGNTVMLVSQDDDNDGTPPDFAWITSGSDKIGWEASAPLDLGVHTNLNVHTQVWDGGSQTSAVDGRAIPLTLSCEPTAISLSSLSAANAGSSFPALPLLGVGMVALGAVAVVRRPCR